MKCRIFVAAVLIIAAALIGRQMSGRHDASGNGAAGREETRRTYALDAGAAVEVYGINGSVEVKTAETDAAEVSIVRTAGSAEDLEHSRVVVEHSPSRLVVRGEGNGRGGFWRRLWGGGSVRHQIVLTVPRGVELETKGVNGPVKIGEVDGAVSVNGVNGRVEVAQAAGRSEVQGVNGAVTITVARSGSQRSSGSHSLTCSPIPSFAHAFVLTKQRLTLRLVTVPLRGASSLIPNEQGSATFSLPS